MTQQVFLLETGLKLLVPIKKQEKFKSLRNKLKWDRSLKNERVALQPARVMYENRKELWEEFHPFSSGDAVFVSLFKN